MGGLGRSTRPAQGPLKRVLLAGTILAAALPSAAEEPIVFEPRANHNTFGMTGLIDMPSAEMQPDGTLTLTTAYHGDGFLKNTLSAQILPGVEGAFRYSVLDDSVLERGEVRTLYDRSFDVKVRLLNEAERRPAVVVGLQDFLGTGVFSGEYIALTKNFLGGDLTATGGLGWGRFAGRGAIDNPLSEIDDRFDERDEGADTGGDVNFGNFFQGEDLGFFGGLQYETPLDGLVLKAEYSSDTYPRETLFGSYEQDSPFNFGAEYRPIEEVQIGAYYLYGNAFGVRLSLSANPFKPLITSDAEPGPLPLTPRPVPENTRAARLLGEVEYAVGDSPALTRIEDSGVASVTVEPRDGLRWATATLPPAADYVCPNQAAPAIDAEYGTIDAVTFVHADGTVVCSVALRPAAERAITRAIQLSHDYPVDWYAQPETRAKLVEEVAEALDGESVGLFGIEIQPRKVEIYVENGKFGEWPKAVGRTARVLARTLPPSVEIFEIVTVNRSLPVSAIILERSALEAIVNQPDASRLAWASATVTDAEKPDWSQVTGTLEKFPRYDYTLRPALPVSLFDPDDPIRVDVEAVASARVEFRPGLSVGGAVRKRLFGEFDEITRESDSEIPRVRSEFARYLEEGDPGINRLTADYLTKLDEDIYGRLSVGYLESQHGGVSGEVLWKPVDQTWGLGAELNYSRQRDFNQLFGFRDYEAVTGHASFYWDTGLYGLYTQVDAGRYLAQDWGATFTVSRKFANGWEIGGFFTLTTVPFDEFGEGSFDKGLLFRIPFDWFLPIESRGRFNYVLRPLTRDGGQRLRIGNRLYGIVEDLDRQALREDWGGFWE